MKVIGVRFKTACRVYSFDAGGVECAADDWVVVETERGMALGQVVGPPREPESPPPQPLKKVLRRAEDRDILRYEQNCELEGYAYQFCLERIRQARLPMKLVDVEYLFDGSKAVFYFTSESRVDFRDLVRDLARQFHTRIEMRQIGVRDEAKMVGGVGCCGRELCCATWLADFAPISVKMAKDQNVSLNPSKISGICGRLMCCLGYEYPMYRHLGRDIPKLGKRVETPRGAGKVVRRNVLEGTFVVLGERGEFEITVDEYQGRQPPEAPQTPAAEKERPVAPAARESRRDRAPEPSGQPSAPPTPGEAAPGSRPAEGRRRRNRRRRKGPQAAGRKTDG